MIDTRCRPLLVGAALLVSQLSRARAAQPAFGTLDGLVADSSLTPIDGALVQVVATNVQVRTSTSGRFRVVKLPVGAYRLLVRKPGFEPVSSLVEVRDGDTTRVTYVLRPAIVSLDTAFVIEHREPDRLAGFAERRSRSIGGRFITRADIEKQAPTAITDLLRRVTGVTVADSDHVLIAISSRGMKTAIVQGHVVPVQCVIPVMVDGVLTDARFPMNSISPNDVHGIEVYVGPSSIPPEFNGARTDSFCGLIVIWTR
jgi:Carboxypeptidase regulatory-like domain/TonB-dependent Receptor Plug Domain